MKYIKLYESFEDIYERYYPIDYVSSYIKGMSAGIEDKLFFFNKIKFDCIVDFGCADGSLLKEISKRDNNIKLIGYDLNENMLELAKENKLENSYFTSKWDNVLSQIDKFDNVLLNLSSVIHEVYSYSHPVIVKKFWKDQVFCDKFKYISIRDMIPSTKIDNIDKKTFKSDVDKIREISDGFYLESFERRWGPIDDNYRTFLHYLLKYRFKDNWEREVQENYLPLSLETLKKRIPENYSILYEDYFILPFLKDKVLLDFNINLVHSTHTKIILELY